MKRTSVAELKARLSHFLRLAQKGETIEVQSHRHPVARIVPAEDVSEALVIPPERPVAELKGLTGVRVAAHADPVAALLRDRARR
jgi:prevent-host-death family protein